MSEESKGGQNASAPEYYEDEISLVDLVGVLVRRKWLVIAGPVLLEILAAGYAFMQPAVMMYLALGIVLGFILSIFGPFLWNSGKIKKTAREAGLRL